MQRLFGKGTLIGRCNSLARSLPVALVYSDTTYIYTSTPPSPLHPSNAFPKTYFVTFRTALSIKTLSYC
jgi:hypothetical protein